MKTKTISLIVITFLVLVVPVLATTCDKASIDIAWQKGTSPPNATLSCSTTSASNVSVSVSGSYISLNSNSLLANSSKVFTVIPDSNAPIGETQRVILFSDSLSVLVKLNVSQVADTNPCQINPSLVSYTQSIQQGTQIPLPNLTFNPINCVGNLVLTPSSVSVQGGIVTTQGQKPVYISSVASDGINLNIDTTGLNTQTYSSILRISAYNKVFEIPFTIIVTSGTSPSGSFNSANLPSCSLTNTILNLNSTYSMVCTNLQPDVTIEPIRDADYIEGTGVETSSTQFVWTFRPRKIGNTIIKADFKYLGVPVGIPYSQEIKVQSSGLAVAGTELYISYAPSLDSAQNGDLIIIQILDNKSRSLVDNPTLYIDNLLVENLSGKSFKYTFYTGKNYSIRAVSPGYSDAVQSVSILSKPINLIMTPSEGDTLTTFNISTDINASIYVNGQLKGNSYLGNLQAGNNTVSAIKEGYLNTEKTIYVSERTSIYSSGGQFKKNVLQTYTLSKNDTWKVYYQKDLTTAKGIYEQYTGTGSKIDFTPKKTGIYSIETSEGQVWTGTIEGINWNTKWWFMPWYLWIIIGGGLIGAFMFMRNNEGSGGQPPAGFAGNVNY